VRLDNEFVYTGPTDQEARTKPQAPLTAETARVVALSAWRTGRLQRTPHFLMRLKARGFSILDVESVIRYGRVVAGPTPCGPPHNNHKYYFRDDVDGVGLKVSFALDAEQDYATCPLVVLITAVWCTASGRRDK